VSFSWVDPHFAALYARREEERLAERLAARMPERAVSAPPLRTICRREPSWIENDALARGGHVKLV
jgi:hypothetical protein